MQSDLCWSTTPEHKPALECGWYTQCHSIKENRSSLSEQVSFGTASCLGVGLHAYFHSMLGHFWIYLVQVSWMLLWVHVCTCPVVFGKYSLSTPSSLEIPRNLFHCFRLLWSMSFCYLRALYLKLLVVIPIHNSALLSIVYGMLS